MAEIATPGLKNTRLRDLYPSLESGSVIWSLLCSLNLSVVIVVKSPFFGKYCRISVFAFHWFRAICTQR